VAVRKVGLVEMIIPESVEVLSKWYFERFESLSSVTFELISRLSQIEEWTFNGTGFVQIIIFAQFEVLDEQCFALLCLDHFPLLHSNQVQDSQELKNRYRLERA
jgi:hypothetical protein